LKAAEAGSAQGQFNLGLDYDQGRGTKQDLKKAFHWYSKAAAQGHPDALLALGIMYDEGRGMPPNPRKASELFRRAATKGNGNARVNLANDYYLGSGVRRDLVRAYALASPIASAGDKELQRFLKDLAREMTPRQIAKARKMRQPWK
jgi:TPR repeat protein